MFVAPTVESFLSRKSLSPDVLARSHQDSLEQAARALNVPRHQFARAVLLNDKVAVSNKSPFMVVLPLDHVLDFGVLQGVSGRDLEIFPVADTHSLFPDCDAGCLPPFGEAYGLEVMYDSVLFEVPEVVFEAGKRNAVVRVTQTEFRKLTRTSLKGMISRAEASLDCSSGGRREAGRCGDFSQLLPLSRLKQRIESIYELPPMPDFVRQITELHHNPGACVADLAAVVSLDPALAAQIMQYAQSPLFGYRGEVNSIQDAIARVLGFDTAMNLALGLATLKPFTIPPDGVLGMNAILQHANFTAVLVRKFGALLPRPRRPVPGLIYLAGLLHNIGYLLFGELFQSEFFLLNRMVSANPAVPIATLEKELLGMGQAREMLALGHGEIGAWLMEKWCLPGEVVTTLQHHHNEHYRGEHEEYVLLVMIADRLLKRYGIGDGESQEIPEMLWTYLKLDEAELVTIVEQLLEECLGHHLHGQGAA